MQVHDRYNKTLKIIIFNTAHCGPDNMFYGSDEEEQITNSLIDQLKEKGYDVVTKVLPQVMFWVAEDYHQDYYVKKNQQPYCHFYQKRF